MFVPDESKDKDEKLKNKTTGYEPMMETPVHVEWALQTLKSFFQWEEGSELFRCSLSSMGDPIKEK